MIAVSLKWESSYKRKGIVWILQTCFEADVLSVYEYCIVLKLQLIMNYKTFSAYLLAQLTDNL